MAIEYVIREEGDVLIVKASGFDESLEEVQAYGMAVIQAARASGCRRVLCLESELAYRLGTFDIYAAAGFIAEHAAGLKRAAVVCHPDFKADGAFWEDVAVNRGLMVRAFQDQSLAEAWVRE